MEQYKQEIQKVINEIEMESNSSIVIFTTRPSFKMFFKEYFPEIEVYLLSENYFSDFNTIYIMPKCHTKTIRIFEEG